MKIKKYFARTFNEGKTAIEADLGTEAVILSSKTSLDGNGNTIFEITAALDEANTKKRPMKAKLAEVSNAVPAFAHFAEGSSAGVSSSNESTQIRSELVELKDNLDEIRDLIRYRFSGSLSYELSNLYKTLIKAELNEDLALKMVNFLSRKNHQMTYDEYLVEAKKYLAKEIITAKTLQADKKQQIAMFVGPTGSGKTMSLVKIAIICKWVHKSNVLIISSDTYKVGGSEQLQTYASIAGLPFRMAYTANEIKTIIDSEKDYNFIFIDTPGRSYKNKDYINELGLIYKTIQPDTTLLTLNSNISEATVSDMIREFSITKPSSVILTKLDEIYRLGGIYSALVNYKLPVSYITNGQQIPDEIEPADKDKLIEMMFEGL